MLICIHREGISPIVTNTTTMKNDYPQSDPTKTASERGRYAGYNSYSMDWNEDTQEWNPYPRNTVQYVDYEEAHDKAADEFTAAYPDI